MCGFPADYAAFEKLSDRQRKALEKSLERRKQEVEAQIKDLTITQ